MKIKVSELSDAIKKASMNGRVEEVVLKKNGTFAVIDEIKEGFILRKLPLAGWDLQAEIGVYDLNLFQKIIAYAKDSLFKADEVELSVEGNKMVMEKDGDKVEFLLSDPSMVASNAITDPKASIEKIREKEGQTIKVQEATIAQITDAIGMLSPEKVSIALGSGKAICFVGDTKKHSIQIPMGKVESKRSYAVSFKPDLFLKVLGLFPKDFSMEIRSDFPLIIETDEYTAVLSPLTAQAANE